MIVIINEIDYIFIFFFAIFWLFVDKLDLIRLFFFLLFYVQQQNLTLHAHVLEFLFVSRKNDFNYKWNIENKQILTTITTIKKREKNINLPYRNFLTIILLFKTKKIKINFL